MVLTRANLAALLALLLGASVWLGWKSSRPLVGFQDQPTGQPARIAAVVDRIDPNTATRASLQRLYRIGPSRAEDIIDYRTEHGPDAFKTSADLVKIKGIGHVTVSAIAAELSLPR